MFINYVDYRKICLARLCEIDMPVHAKRYFSDLYRSYKMPLEINKIEPVYRYDDMASFLFDVKDNQTVCAQSDYLLFPSWGWIFGSNYAMPELYLKNKFNWRASILDIRDCGSLCVYYALHLMSQLYQHQTISNSAICSIENAFCMRDVEDSTIFPDINFVALLSFSRQKNKKSDIEILHCNVVCYAENSGYQKIIYEKIAQLKKQYQIKSNQYQIIMRSVGNTNSFIANTTTIAHSISSGFVYDILLQIQQLCIQINTEYVFIVDFDFNVRNIGILLIKWEK